MAIPYAKLIAGLLVLSLSVPGYLVAAEYYPCQLPAFTARHAKRQVGHFMRSAGVNAEALNFISLLRVKGAGTDEIARLTDDCRGCFLRTESIGFFQSIWAADFLFPSKGRTVHVVLHIASCDAVLIERSLRTPQ